MEEETNHLLSLISISSTSVPSSLHLWRDSYFFQKRKQDMARIEGWEGECSNGKIFSFNCGRRRIHLDLWRIGIGIFFWFQIQESEWSLCFLFEWVPPLLFGTFPAPDSLSVSLSYLPLSLVVFVDRHHFGLASLKEEQGVDIKSKHFDMVNALPAEISFDILAKCDLKSLATACRVSRSWKRFVSLHSHFEFELVRTQLPIAPQVLLRMILCGRQFIEIWFCQRTRTPISMSRRRRMIPGKRCLSSFINLHLVRSSKSLLLPCPLSSQPRPSVAPPRVKFLQTVKSLLTPRLWFWEGVEQESLRWQSSSPQIPS